MEFLPFILFGVVFAVAAVAIVKLNKRPYTRGADAIGTFATATGARFTEGVASGRVENMEWRAEVRSGYEFGHSSAIPVLELATPHSFPESELLFKGPLGLTKAVHRISGLHTYEPPTAFSHRLTGKDVGFLEALYSHGLEQALPQAPISYRLLPEGIIEARAVGGAIPSWTPELLKQALEAVTALERLCRSQNSSR